MAGITLSQAEAQLGYWMQASQDLAEGKTVMRDGNMITMAETLDQIKFWDQKVKSLDAATRKLRHRRVIPIT